MKKIIVLVITVLIGVILFFTLKTSSESTLSDIDVSNLTEKTLSSYNITEEGKYEITGEVESAITIDVDGVVNLILNNASLKNIIINKGKVLITLNGENYSDDNSTLTDEIDGAIYSEDDIEFDGTGSLNIKSSKIGIHSKGNILIKEGVYTIESYLDGIFAKEVLQIENGTFLITSEKSTISETESMKGLKAKEKIIINGGTFNIDVTDDSIHSNGEITINNGEFTLSTKDDGMHTDEVLTINDGIINITKSYEGLEAAEININGGEISVVSSDDGINASKGTEGSMFQSDGSVLNITGGYIIVNASGDGIDSNGDINMSGGTVIVYGPTSDGDGALDKNGTFKITGGTLLAGGSSGMAEMPTSGLNSVMINFSKNISNQTIYIKSNGETILEYTSPKVFNNLVLSSSEFKINETYEVYIDDTFYTDIKITSSSTTVGQRSNNTQNNRPFHSQN